MLCGGCREWLHIAVIYRVVHFCELNCRVFRCGSAFGGRTFGSATEKSAYDPKRTSQLSLLLPFIGSIRRDDGQHLVVQRIGQHQLVAAESEL
jgi:hypothetical protein